MHGPDDKLKMKTRCIGYFSDECYPMKLALTQQWIHLFYYPEEDDPCASDTSSFDLLGNNGKLYMSSVAITSLFWV